MKIKSEHFIETSRMSCNFVREMNPEARKYLDLLFEHINEQYDTESVLSELRVEFYRCESLNGTENYTTMILELYYPNRPKGQKNLTLDVTEVGETEFPAIESIHEVRFGDSVDFYVNDALDTHFFLAYIVQSFLLSQVRILPDCVIYT